MLFSLDTEATGLDLRHGARPFLVTICTDQGQNLWWEWEVDPLTRKVLACVDDLKEIQELICQAESIILQNTKYDVTGLVLLYRDNGMQLVWPWDKTLDTLMAGHLLASNHPHSLAAMAVEYLAVDITEYEVDLRLEVDQARRYAKKHYPDWRIAKKGLPEMPSAKEKVWKNDLWLPRQLAIVEDLDDDHLWRSICSNYANTDSAATLGIGQEQERQINQRGLMPIYKERLKLLPIIYKMEERGITLSKQRLDQLAVEYKQESKRLEKICGRIAKNYGVELTLPKSGNNKSLKNTVFGEELRFCENCNEQLSDEFKPTSEYRVCPECKGLAQQYIKPNLNMKPVTRSKKTGEPSLDANTIEYYIATLPHRSSKLKFFESLSSKRKRDTAVNYLEGYKRFWIPLDVYNGTGEQLWFRLHASLNPTGTDTLRWSSSNPNEQNISKKEGFNLRHCFGPAPGREWWSMDAQNIELRIPAFEAGEEELMYIFNHPDEPPYYGSYHLVVAELLHPKLFKEWGVQFKEKFESSWYQWVKNGNFAVIYGCQEEKADLTYKVPGAYKKIRHRFPKIAELSDKQISMAERLGYVETIPDKNVCPEHGYPLLCAREQWGRVKPTIPFNYHIQSTAMWWMSKAMIKIQPVLDQWTRRDPRGYYMIMQVHDELVFDFPKGKTPDTNLAKVSRIKELMEMGGEDIGVPTPVGVKYHPETWATAV